ncbi:MAG: OstA-like protein [Bacteroidota bacterium]
MGVTKVKPVLIILLGLLAFGKLNAQKNVKLERAENLYGGVDENGERYNSPVGDVVFKQNETIIYCDSAIFYENTNAIRAFGNVKITDGDSVTITSRRLFYDGESKKAELREEVVFTKLKQLTLYTDFLDYYRIRQEAQYFNGGKLVDSTNVLTSEKGYYLVNTNMASFKKNVVGTNPDYTLESDTLQYNTETNIVYFRDQTKLTDVDGNVFNYEEGSYDTRIKRSNLSSGTIETTSYDLTGDKLFLDDIKKYYTATGNVEMISKEQDIIITGDFSYYDKVKGRAKVYGNTLMKKVMQLDTLYLTADTLVAIENEDPSQKRLLAYHNVNIFKSDLQGIADSLVYVNIDSILYFYNDPVLWTGGNQMTADSINVEIVNNTIDKLNMRVNSFVVSQDSIKNFNQIKGRNMVAFFNSGAINKVDVDGNGESLFFALDETDSYLVGMNKIICSNITINFKENLADNISFYIKPDASFIPPHELTDDVKRLKNFQWLEEYKPVLSTMLENKRHANISPYVENEDTKLIDNNVESKTRQSELPSLQKESLEKRGLKRNKQIKKKLDS